MKLVTMWRRRWWFWPGMLSVLIFASIAFAVIQVKIHKVYIPRGYFVYRKHDIYAGPSGFGHAERIINALHQRHPDTTVLLIYKTDYPGTPFDPGEFKIYAGLLLPHQPQHLESGWREIAWPGQTAYWVIHDMRDWGPYDFIKIARLAISIYGIRNPYWDAVCEGSDGKIANLVITKCPAVNFCTLRTWHCGNVCR